MANKVKYGLSSCYYAVLTESTSGVTYGTPVALPGAVNFNQDQEGETNKFRADNIDFYVSVSNNGYSGDLELALVPDSFLKDVMGETVDASNGLQIEFADAKPKAFALLMQFEGDAESTRHVFYNCKATRPSVSSKTTEESIEPVTETINITASAVKLTVAGQERPVVKAKCDSTASTAYASFFSVVQLPTASTG